MEQIDADTLIRLLYAKMSTASEDCWCAGWMAHTEEDLPAVCRAVQYGEDTQVSGPLWSMVAPHDALELCQLADALGHWVKPVYRPEFRLEPYTPRCDVHKPTTLPKGQYFHLLHRLDQAISFLHTFQDQYGIPQPEWLDACRVWLAQQVKEGH